jgi:hypothetical protein
MLINSTNATSLHTIKNLITNLSASTQSLAIAKGMNKALAVRCKE